MRQAMIMVLALGALSSTAEAQQWSTTTCRRESAKIPPACCPNGACRGMPTMCTKQCAKVFKPIWWKCRGVMAAGGQGDANGVFMKKCLVATNSVRPLPGDTGHWEDGSGASSNKGGNTAAGRSRACCEAKPQWKGRARGTPVCGFSPRSQAHKCYTQATQAQANATCKAIGARLCTKTELMKGEASATGCGHDNRPVWSSTPCKDGQFTVVTSKGSQSGCVSASRPFAVRCCADYCDKSKISQGSSGGHGGGSHQKGGGQKGGGQKGGGHQKGKCAGNRACNKGHAVPPVLPPPAKARGGKPYGTDPSTGEQHTANIYFQYAQLLQR